MMTLKILLMTLPVWWVGGWSKLKLVESAQLYCSACDESDARRWLHISRWFCKNTNLLCPLCAWQCFLSAPSLMPCQIPQNPTQTENPIHCKAICKLICKTIYAKFKQDYMQNCMLTHNFLCFQSSRILEKPNQKTCIKPQVKLWTSKKVKVWNNFLQNILISNFLFILHQITGEILNT